MKPLLPAIEILIDLTVVGAALWLLSTSVDPRYVGAGITLAALLRLGCIGNHSPAGSRRGDA